jgi:hypothetical protein
VEPEPPQMTEGRDPKSDLHPHDFLVGFQDFVSDLHHGPKRDVGLLERDHGLVNAAGLAELNARDGLVGVILKMADLGDGLFQHIAEGPLGLAGILPRGLDGLGGGLQDIASRRYPVHA